MAGCGGLDRVAVEGNTLIKSIRRVKHSENLLFLYKSIYFYNGLCLNSVK
jgi:hypothetical protein